MLELRHKVAAHAREKWYTVIPGAGMTVGQILTALGWDKERYLASVVTHSHWVEEPELSFLPCVLKVRLRVFLDHGDHWQECVQYGSTGPLRRVVFHQDRGHYDLILFDGSHEPERSHHTTRGGESLRKKRELLLTIPRRAGSSTAEAAQKRRAKVRREKLKASRQGTVSMEDVELLLGFASDLCPREQNELVARVVTATTPWQALGVQESTPTQECVAAYRSLSLSIHPDKCHHPRSREAFQKLGDAKDWVDDREAWYANKQHREMMAHQANLWAAWVTGGGQLKALQTEEEVRRHLGLGEDGMLRIPLEEGAGWQHIGLIGPKPGRCQRADGGTARAPGQNRSDTRATKRSAERERGGARRGRQVGRGPPVRETL